MARQMCKFIVQVNMYKFTVQQVSLSCVRGIAHV